MQKIKQFSSEHKKEVIAFSIFIVGLFLFSINYAFAAIEPVRSIVITSENKDFASGEEGSWQVTKSGYWTNYGEAEVTLDVDTSLMTNNQYTDIIFVLDISGSMSGEKLDRVKSDSKELVSNLLSNQNNRAALITFDTESQIVSELTNDEELLISEIDNLKAIDLTNYYQALVNVDNILQNYQKEDNREMIVLFLTDGYPNVDIPNQIGEYQYLKSAYPYVKINGIQYEMGNTILSPIEEISDNQFIADMDTLNNVLFDASVAPITYDTYQIIDYIDNENFFLESKNDIKVTTGSVELTNENGRQKIIWTLDGLASGRDANLTMKLKLKDELLGQGGIYPTNESTEVISKIENEKEDVTTTNTPILADNYKVIYDGNAPEGCSVSNVPDTYNYSVYSTVEISDDVPVCEGYEFKGWDISTKDVTRVGEDYFIMPESDVVIKAEWSKIGITKSMNGTVNDMGDPIMKRYTYSSSSREDYHSSTYKSKITSIVTKDNLEIPSTAIEYWDVSEAGDGSVIAYIEDDGRGAGTYKVTIGGQEKIIANPNSSYLFFGNSSYNSFSSLESVDLTYLDTHQVTNMSYMFQYCSSLSTVDLSKLNTDNVINMSYMFSNTGLSSISFYGFNTSKVQNVSYMFSNCKNLSSFSFMAFEFNSVTTMSGMFSGCSNLSSFSWANLSAEMTKVTDMSYLFQNCISLDDSRGNIDFNRLNTTSVTNMSGIFQGCGGLSEINSIEWDTSQVTNMAMMFSGCRSLTNINLNNWDTSQVTDMSYMFSGCRSLTNINLNNWDTSQVTDMSYMFSNTGISSISFSGLDTSNVKDVSYMFSNCKNLSSFSFVSFEFNSVTTMRGMFSGCSDLSSFSWANLSAEMTKVTDMSYLFQDCISLDDSGGNIDFNRLNTTSVTNMEFIFDGCTGLIEISLGGWNTANVTDMSSMFTGCTNLTKIHNLDLWNTSEVTNMSYMFSNCSSLPSLDLSSFDTSQVTSMREMFNGCSSLTSLDLSNFDTSQVKDMSSMFQYCSGLTSLDLSNFDTSKVTNMSSMFRGCSSLSNLNVSSFDTSQVTNMMSMFMQCRSLTSLDLSSFDTSKVTQIGNLFSDCKNLTYLDIRNATLHTTSYWNVFDQVSNGITIIVKDATEKAWIESRLNEASVTGTVTIASA